MKVWADMHIHSCLSPCADDEMTPQNIVNMALLKGLNMIAVTDHNAADNLPAILKAAEGTALTVVPGMELTTKEEVHVLGYFPSLEQVQVCAAHIAAHLQKLPNNPRFFGRQLIMDAEDQVTGELSNLLLQATDLSVEDMFALVRDCGGVPVPAHIDRPSHGILALLGFINPDLHVTCAEISRNALAVTLPDPQMQRISSSDAHQLGDIFEQVQALELPECTPAAFLKYVSRLMPA